MPIIMPGEVNVKYRCPICSKEAVSRGKVDGNYVYWGGEATCFCWICERLICPIHMHSPRACADCYEK